MYLPNPEYSRVALVVGKERKRLFLEKCVVEGRSMTEIMQQLVDRYISTPPRRRVVGEHRLYKVRAGGGVFPAEGEG